MKDEIFINPEIQLCFVDKKDQEWKIKNGFRFEMYWVRFDLEKEDEGSRRKLMGGKEGDDGVVIFGGQAGEWELGREGKDEHEEHGKDEHE